MEKLPLNRPSASFGPDIVFRSASIFIILFQLRLIAADLADTSIFTATLLLGFAAAVFLRVFRVNGISPTSVTALVSIGLIHWTSRALIAVPRFFMPGRTDEAAVFFDSLLLNLDRNNFVSLLPFYWIAASSWFAMRSRKFLRAAVITDAVILLFIYSVARAEKIELYRWPVVTVVLFAAVVFFQALALLFSTPPETRLRRKEACFAVMALFAVASLGSFLFLKPFQEHAVEMGGGLLKPKLFSFDFSQFLKLDSEISMKNDLVMIVKKDDDGSILLRRSVLSGYGRKQGFFRIEELDERAHPQRLPGRHVSLKPAEFDAARIEKQEYFLVNFDASAFIGMKEPVSISPYENWDASSFSSAYAVESMVSDASFLQLSRAADDARQLGAAELGLSENEFKTFTDYGNETRILTLAEEITKGRDSYSGKVAALYEYLKYGEYRYSLKPGIAPDGDQLGWFLFNSKKGYCSYFSFAFALLLRSIGIPARIAAGFFVDPETNTFDYYPVRSDMAHAWVEVAFPRYGWIEFDPTTKNLAEGEEFSFSTGVDHALFEKYMREILENRFRMRVKEVGEDVPPASPFSSLARKSLELLRNYSLLLAAIALLTLFLHVRCGLFISVFLTRDPRVKSVRLLKHACRLLRLAGERRDASLAPALAPALAVAQWCQKLDLQYGGIYSLYQGGAAARFAPEYAACDFLTQKANYKNFRTVYMKRIPFWRLIASWIFPPLTLASSPSKKRNIAPLLLAVFLSGLLSGSAAKAQSELGGDKDLLSADELYEEASDADYAEYWERAIELYRRGGERFPDDIRFPWALGNLFYNRFLYGLAWDEYRKVEANGGNNSFLLSRMARTAGHLNRDDVSVEYYERALETDPDNKDVIGSLGWMYFKVHRLLDGEKLLVSALEHFGGDADFSMTLGTVYSDMYRYDDSKHWYNKAIALGEITGDRAFTAVAWYNLSILESRFYRYGLCMDATNSSLESQNRSSGHLARGELYQNQLQLEKARGDYEAAYETDISPLAKLSLAQVYQVSGRLEEARLYAEDCLRRGDNSWMLNFGIDPVRYKRDIHQILYKTYSGLAQAARLRRSFVQFIAYSFKAKVNLLLYRKYCLDAADAYRAKIQSGGPYLDSFTQYYNAFEAYPRRAAAYLGRARAFETEIIPASVPSYDMEEGILLRKTNLIEKALDAIDPLWERELIARCYMELALMKGRGAGEKRSAVEKLFVLNRGALLQSGINLPVRIEITENEGASVSRKALLRALKAAGFSATGEGCQGCRFTLSVIIDRTLDSWQTAFCVLSDSAEEVKPLVFSFPISAVTRATYHAFAQSLGDAVFRVD
jgi:tetratricopeptide (TPR) repeat protein